MNQPTVFVLEDDLPLLGIFDAFLTEEGYRVVGWTTSAGAYQALRSHAPTLAIVDVRMERPESGWELVQLVRGSTDLKQLPIIISTADTRFAREKAAELAALHCSIVIKPFALDDLLRVIQKHLARLVIPQLP